MVASVSRDGRTTALNRSSISSLTDRPLPTGPRHGAQRVFDQALDTYGQPQESAIASFAHCAPTNIMRSDRARAYTYAARLSVDIKVRGEPGFATRPSARTLSSAKTARGRCRRHRHGRGKRRGTAGVFSVASEMLARLRQTCRSVCGRACQLNALAHSTRCRVPLRSLTALQTLGRGPGPGRSVTTWRHSPHGSLPLAHYSRRTASLLRHRRQEEFRDRNPRMAVLAT